MNLNLVIRRLGDSHLHMAERPSHELAPSSDLSCAMAVGTGAPLEVKTMVLEKHSLSHLIR